MVREKLVTVVDDDESVREALPDLLRSFGFEVQSFASADAFLASESIGSTDCLILDVAMPGMTGPELQLELNRRNADIEIVFITAYADETLRAQVLKRGASAFLLKPFSERAIVKALNEALAKG